MSRSDIILIVFTALSATGVFIASVVVMALRLQAFILKTFSDHREFVREHVQAELMRPNRAIFNIENFMVRRFKGAFQPAADTD